MSQPPGDHKPKKPSNPYLSRLTPSERRAFLSASTDLDLSDEIRLTRVVLASLIEGLPDSAHLYKEVLSVLVRAIHIQARQLGGTNDLEQALIDAAELTLDRLALEDVTRDP